ncbi:MAG: L-serine ammonia-lyase, iron-sulfur-dependent, subunit alpha [Clostridia bacterium]
MYSNFSELLELCHEKSAPISLIVLENEIKTFERTREQVLDGLRKMYAVMGAAAEKALNKPLTAGFSLISGVAMHQNQHAHSGRTICGGVINKIMARALSCSETNAAMGKICAAPTAGACGILPAVIITLSEQTGCSQEDTLMALLTASGVGAVIIKNATVSGAEGGCQAECGVAAAMAAAGAVELYGGSPEQALDAAALALENVMGLICDPVAGLVQVPCAARNASQALNALASADLALGGMRSLIPLDEVVEAMHKVGRQLPMQLKETALGGIAATPTGKSIKIK